MFLIFCEERAGKFLITPEWLGFLAHDFVPVVNFMFSNFLYDRISKMSPRVKQQVVKIGSETL